MTDSERESSESKAAVFKALAHPTRIFIVEKLRTRAYCVCELTELIGADTSTVSKHLSVLKNAGVISDRREKTSIYYSLNLPCITNLLSCIE